MGQEKNKFSQTTTTAIEDIAGVGVNRPTLKQETVSADAST